MSKIVPINGIDDSRKSMMTFPIILSAVPIGTPFLKIIPKIPRFIAVLATSPTPGTKLIIASNSKTNGRSGNAKLGVQPIGQDFDGLGGIFVVFN